MNDPIKPRPEPSILWEATLGAIRMAAIFISLAIIIGGIWALGW